MLTRREVLGLIPAAALAGAARVKGAEAPGFERIDTHIHIHRDAPALSTRIKASNWRGLDIVVCPASGDESFDLEEKLRATLKVHRDSGGTLAWASTFDARGFESPDFAERTIARLRRSFDDGAVGVKIWKNIGMSIKSKSGAYLLPDDPALLPIYEAIQKAGKTLVAHLAEPDGAWLPLDAKNPEITYYSTNPQWHMYGKPGAPVKDAILTARDRVLARYPEPARGRVPPRQRRGRPGAAGEAARRLSQLRRRHRGPHPLLRPRRPRPGPGVPDPVPGPHPLRHRLLPPRGRPGRRGAGRCRQRTTATGTSSPAATRWSTTAGRRGGWPSPKPSSGRSSARTPSAGCPASRLESRRWVDPLRRHEFRRQNPFQGNRSSRDLGMQSEGRMGRLISLAWLYAVELAIAALALVGFARLAREVAEGELHSLNVRVLQGLYDHRSPGLDTLAIGLSRLGDPAGTTALGTLGVLLFCLHRRRPRRRGLGRDLARRRSAVPGAEAGVPAPATRPHRLHRAGDGLRIPQRPRPDGFLPLWPPGGPARDR